MSARHVALDIDLTDAIRRAVLTGRDAGAATMRLAAAAGMERVGSA